MMISHLYIQFIFKCAYPNRSNMKNTNIVKTEKPNIT